MSAKDPDGLSGRTSRMKALRRWLPRGFGLRARMAASYVLVTFAAVVLVEVLAAALVIPNANARTDVSSRVVTTANDFSVRYSNILQKLAGTSSDPTVALDSKDVLQLFQDQRIRLGVADAHLNPGQERPLDNGVLIPYVDGPLMDNAPMSLAFILDPNALVYASSYPGRYAPGSSAVQWLPGGWDKGALSGVGKLSNGQVVWATQPIFRRPFDPTGLDPKGLAAAQNASVVKGAAGGEGKEGTGGLQGRTPPLGYVYVQVPFQPTGLSFGDLKPQLFSGLWFLIATIPVGVLFGLLTTHGMIRRLRRLAAGTVGFASGDFSQRVPESGADEVGQLERHFNRMAERLNESIAEQQALAEKNARLAERSRISRELHDSISQDLFSISALAGGLRKALPADSPLQPQLETLSETVGSTIQEMRALLLELRPTALEEKGLVPALADLCDAYEVRVGVRVRKELAPIVLDPAAEQAMFRIAQEGLSNAVRHSEADEIEVRLRQDGTQAELTVADNGRGFDSEEAPDHGGLGLKLMAERIRELGGSMAIESALGKGTSLRVLLPAAAAA